MFITAAFDGLVRVIKFQRKFSHLPVVNVNNLIVVIIYGQLKTEYFSIPLTYQSELNRLHKGR